MSFIFLLCMTPDYWLPPSTPTSPVLSYLKLSWAAQRAWLCVTPCQVLLETVRWQPPSLSAAPCPLRGWGGAIALHPPAPQRCDRKAWLAVTRPRWGGTLRRGEETRKREGTQVVSEQLHGGVILSIQQDLKSGWGWWGWGSVCVYVCVPGGSMTLPRVFCWDILRTWYGDSDGPGWGWMDWSGKRWRRTFVRKKAAAVSLPCGTHPTTCRVQIIV